MAISLVNNLGSLESQTKLSNTGSRLNKDIQRLSSGLRINSSGDDAAGLAIANAFRSDITKLRQGIRNANDGVSTLQIVDGGLNTISSLLDRSVTLATQSASDTFTGDRDTLQAELNKVLGEIDRQSQQIGLGADTGANGRFNKALNVYVGGGASGSATNNSVTVDLSSSRVDTTQLGVNGLNIGNGTGSVTGATALPTTTGAAETLTFQYVGSSGSLTTTPGVVIGASSTASQVLDTINNDVNVQKAGVKAELDATGKLVLRSASFFTVSSNLAGAGTNTNLVAAANNVAISGAAFSTATLTVSAAAAASTQQLSFTGSGLGFTNDLYNVSINTVTAGQVASVVSQINSDNTLKAAGIFAVAVSATQVQLTSLKRFSLGVDAAATVANSNLAAQVATTATGGTSTGGALGAKDALDKLQTAIANLGKVQGKVGAGQNNLAQAIDLASSQVTNFQAAESRIRDADVASESSDLARLTVLQQAGVAALAQANQSNQAVLSLLK
jgi:flagellin